MFEQVDICDAALGQCLAQKRQQGIGFEQVVALLSLGGSQLLHQ